MAIRTMLGLAAMTLLCGSLARAETYTFTTVVDSQRDGLTATRCAAINATGRIAVTVRDESSGLTKIITKASATDAPVVVADTSSAADFPTLCDNGFSSLPSDPSINASGQVAFQGNPRRVTLASRPECATPAQRARRQGVFLGNGGALATIAHTINPPGGNVFAEFLVADQSVNNAGRVAFVPELDDTFEHGLYVGARHLPFDQRFLADTPTADGFDFNNLSSRVSLNDAGQVAFESGRNDTFASGIFLSETDGTFRTIVDDSSGLSTGDPSLNNDGLVAFTAFRFDEAFNQIASIHTSDGTTLATVAESSAGGFVSFREPSLNDDGQLAFTADVQPDPNDFFTTVQGVFTGGDPVADKVLQAGDLVEGVPVTSVVTCAEALNSRGEIVMTVFSEDPATFETRVLVVKATPVP